MRAKCPIISHREREYLYRGIAVLSLLVWLLLAAAEAWAPFHAWLHGGAIPDNDDCPVAALVQGKVAVAVVAAVVLVCLGTVVAFRFVLSVPFVASVRLPDVRGPPPRGLATAAS